MKYSRTTSKVMLGLLGIGTYLLGSTIVMLRINGDLKPLVLDMPQRMKDKKLEAEVEKLIKERKETSPDNKT